MIKGPRSRRPAYLFMLPQKLERAPATACPGPAIGPDPSPARARPLTPGASTPMLCAAVKGLRISTRGRRGTPLAGLVRASSISTGGDDELVDVRLRCGFVTASRSTFGGQVALRWPRENFADVFGRGRACGQQRREMRDLMPSSKHPTVVFRSLMRSRTCRNLGNITS